MDKNMKITIQIWMVSSGRGFSYIYWLKQVQVMYIFHRMFMKTHIYMIHVHLWSFVSINEHETPIDPILISIEERISQVAV